MKLLPIPGAPGYRIDCENQVAYSLKKTLRELKHRTKYKVLAIQVGGMQLQTTVYRMMYCAQNGIDITKIPPGTCIGYIAGKVTVTDREEIMERAKKTAAKSNPKYKEWKHNIALLNKYYRGDSGPLLEKLKDIEKSIKLKYVTDRGLCEERAEIVAEEAVNRYLDALADGYPSSDIFGQVYRYSKVINLRMRMHYLKFHDNMQPIIIEDEDYETKGF